MELGSSVKPQVTALFDNVVLSRLERLRLNASRRFTSRSRGEHLTGRGGTSTEFCDYRNYVEGDDVRFVDWNIFSRLHRPYLKLFHMEEEMHVVLLIDASSSMRFDGKIQRAKQLAAALGVMGLYGIERVSVYSFNEREGELRFLPPCTGRTNLRRLFNFVESIEAGGDAPLEIGVEKLLTRHRGRGMIAVCSDFLSFGDLRKAFNMLFNSGLEIFGVQVLAPGEIDPELTGDLRLLDCEDGRTLDITNAGELLALYHEYRQAFQRTLEILCTQRCGRFLTASSHDDLNDILFDTMRRRGWVR